MNTEIKVTTLAEMQRKIVLSLWNDGMEGTRTDDGTIRVLNDDGSQFVISVEAI